MPIGLIVWTWDERSGPDIIDRYPKDVQLTGKTMIQLYTQHLYSQTADTISLFISSINVISIWTGNTYNYFLTCVLAADENGDDYIDYLPNCLYALLPYLTENKNPDIMGLLFNQIIEYPSTSPEQRLGYLYQIDGVRLILNNLLEEGSYHKDELKIWLDDQLSIKVFNYEMILEKLSQDGFIKVESVKNVEGEYLFLLKYFIIFRTPPQNFIQHLSEIKDSELTLFIINNVKEFFVSYQPTEQDNLNVINLLMKNDYYQVFQMLRSKAFLSDTDLKKIKFHPEISYYDIMKDLEKMNLITSITNKDGKLFYILKSDMVIDIGFPEFLLNLLFSLSKEEKRNKKIVLEHLRLLSDSYSETVIPNKKQKLIPKAKKAQDSELILDK
jgi:hypothetical protein